MKRSAGQNKIRAMLKGQILVLAGSLLMTSAFAQQKYSTGSSFKSYKGLIMAGYQGWFNAPSDGAEMGWNHYATKGKFEPGYCKIDFWIDQYSTSFDVYDRCSREDFRSIWP